MENPAVQLLRSLPIGTRVVVRYRIPGGFTDALGDLVGMDARSCRVATRRGEASIELSEVVLAKPVPPAPTRRRRSPRPENPSDLPDVDTAR
jgi:hypothetical protein